MLQEEFLVSASYFEGKKPIVIPHRGGRNIVPENTLHAIENTYKEKFTHFETDLRMSKDGVIFLHHDRSFDRTTDIKGNVHDFDWEDIKRINAGATFYKKKGDHSSKTTFVSLEDALTTYKNLKFNLDLKQGGMAEKVVKIIKSTKSIERVLVSSFSYRRLDE
ncbi:MAG: glycerophosphodiester phosphodiesterase family protein, partial [Actinomycetota bacterium]|nr:glycerophosphodiester phosphodiesterase family protein [Actinomycetota bacterium]